MARRALECLVCLAHRGRENAEHKPVIGRELPSGGCGESSPHNVLPGHWQRQRYRLSELRNASRSEAPQGAFARRLACQLNEDFLKALRASDLYGSLVSFAEEEPNLYVTMDQDREVFLYSKPEKGVDQWTVLGERVGEYDGMPIGYLNSPVPLDWRACCVSLRRVAGHQHQADINEVLPEIDSTGPDAWI